jgi:hypothetical protein
LGRLANIAAAPMVAPGVLDSSMFKSALALFGILLLIFSGGSAQSYLSALMYLIGMSLYLVVVVIFCLSVRRAMSGRYASIEFALALIVLMMNFVVFLVVIFDANSELQKFSKFVFTFSYFALISLTASTLSFPRKKGGVVAEFIKLMLFPFFVSSLELSRDRVVNARRAILANYE